MKRLLPGALFVLSAAAWGCGGGGAEIPTVELGSGGARLMNGQAKSPAEAYDAAYAILGRAHYNVRRNLESRGRNEVGAREAMTHIVRSLEIMRGCVPEADREKFDPYLSRYGGWVKDIENGTWGGSFLTDFDRLEREVKAALNPSGIRVLAEFPGTPAKPALSPDKVELPAGRTPAVEEAPKAPPEPPPPPTPAATSRIFYKAWSAAHDDLIAAYKNRKPCKTKYDDVVDSLRLLKAQLAGEKAAKLQIYIDYYGGIDEKTKTFSALPEKTTEKDIVDELDVAARVIRKEFSPEK